jgi:hypothetical protein
MKPHLSLLFIGLTGTALAQGPLTPPPGADPSIGPVNALTAGGLPQATMKTLHEVEPRTAIAGGTSGMTISASGAYYLTGNITVATGDGITINASNVTLDLNGFSITTSAAPAAGIGVRLGQGLRNVAIRNGNIGGDGLGGAFTGGVYYMVSGFPQPPSNLRVADLSVAASEFGISAGITVATFHVERCMVIGGSAHGIQGGIVKDCVVEGGPIIGRIVKDCSVTTPGDIGIYAEVVENCYATSAGTAIQAKCVVNSFGSTSGANSYPLPTVLAGIANNVWAEGSGGDGDAINATTVANSVGQRPSDPFGSTPGNATGSGIEATIVQGSVGVTTSGKAIEGKVVSVSQGTTDSGRGIFATIVTGSNGLGTAVNSYGIESELISQSKGVGLLRGLSTDRGVVVGSIGKCPSGNSNIPIIATNSVLVGVNATTDDIFGGISLTGGLAVNAFANGFGVEVPGGLVAHSVGKRVLDIGGGNQAGIRASIVNGSRGTGSTGVVGILADLIDGSFGSGTGGTTSGALEFNSN